MQSLKSPADIEAAYCFTRHRCEGVLSFLAWKFLWSRQESTP
ncbi:hypothetical protein J8V12_03175 [Photorhabdus thracensis]|nr:hypothetical protein [Photorhabdus thracensis]